MFRELFRRNKKENINMPNQNADREDEVKAIKSFSENHILIYSQPGHGLSSFLKDKLALRLKGITFYVESKNACDSNTFLYRIEKEIRNSVKKEDKINRLSNRMSRIILSSLYTTNFRFLSVLILLIALGATITGIGSSIVNYLNSESISILDLLSTVFGAAFYFIANKGLQDWVAKKEALNRDNSDHYSVVMQRLGKFLDLTKKHLQNEKIYFFIDNAQDADENSFTSWIRLYKNYPNVVCIYAFSDPTNNKTEKNVLDLKIIAATDNCIEYLFPEPSEFLVKEIYKEYHKDDSELHELNDKKAAHWLLMSNKDIRRICELVQEQGEHQELSPVEIAIITWLNISSHGLTKNAILSLCESDKSLHPNRNGINKAINNLLESNIITIDNSLVRLYSNDLPEAYKNNHQRTLLCLEELYNYYLRIGVDELSVDELYIGYNHAKKTYKNEKHIFARNLLSRFLNERGDIDSSIFDDAALSENNPDDCVMAAVFFYLLNDYDKAFDWLDKAQAPKKDKNIEKLLALVANRKRMLSDAKDMLIHCINNEGDNSQKSLLLATLTSVYYHSNELDNASKLYETYYEQISGCRHSGYFLRNIAWAHPDYEKIYDKAISNFRTYNDSFGEFSTLSNWGNKYTNIALANNDLEIYIKAAQKLTTATQELEKLGGARTNYVYNNLGINYLLSGDTEKAIELFHAAIHANKNRMPTIFSTINLACCYLSQNEQQQALSIIESLESLVEQHELDRVREKYYINRLFVEYACGNIDLDRWVDKVNLYPDRYNPNETKLLLEFYSKPKKKSYSAKDFNRLFSPCNLAYWDINPFKILNQVKFY